VTIPFHASPPANPRVSDDAEGAGAAAARRLAVFFSATHSAVSVAGVIWPVVYGFALGPGGRSRRVRVLAAVDSVPALAVLHAATTGGPLRDRLRIGAGSDLARALVLGYGFPASSRAGRTALVAASLAGATTAAIISTRV